MNILTDILSLIRQGVFTKIAEKNDVLVLGKWNETPDMTGVASPIPYKAVKLIKVSDFKIAAEHCGYKNSPIIPIGDTAGVYQKTVVDETTEECTVYFRTLKSLSSNLTLALSADDDYIEITTEGEPNTAANVGTGTGLWKNKVGETLNFKSLLPGNNITITENVNEILISSSASSITLADNVGTGFGIYKDKVGETLNFKSLISSNNSIVITETTNEINLASTNSGANFGLVYQIPITNALVDNFNYDSGFTYDGSRLLAEGTGTNSVSIGTDTVGSGDGSIAIGRYSTATAQGAIIMGYHSSTQTNSLEDSFKLAWDGNAAFHVIGGASKVNYLQIDSSLTTVSPIISAVGTDTNINLTLTPKGTGTVAITGTLDALNHDIKNVKSFTANSQVSGNLSGASPVIADFSTSNFQRKIITSNVTGAPTIIDPLGPTNLVLVLVQGTGGNMTINAWQPGVYWPGGIKPVLSTAAGAIDVISFYFDGTSYFGFYGLNFS